MKPNKNQWLVALKKISPAAWFWVAIVAIALVYNFHHIVVSRPIGIHQWRNSVCAGYALNYYYGADFLTPKTEGFIADNHRSNIFVLEFPALYYAVGKLYQAFGYHEFLYRLFNMLIGFLGLFFLFKASRKIFDNPLVAAFFPLLVFTSTVYLFYMSNFIPDATAMAVSFIGFYFFYLFYLSQKHKQLVVAMLFFSLAGLLKIQSLYLYFAIFGVFFFELVFRKNFGKNQQRLFPKPLKAFLIFCIVLVFNFAWYYYGQVAAEMYGFASSSRLRSAIWHLEPQLIDSIWELFVKRFNSGQFYPPVFIYFALLVFIHNLIFLKKHNAFFNVVVILLFIEVVLFNLLFFESIGRCDYYNINSLIFFVFVFINFFLFLKNKRQKFYKSFYFGGVVGILSLFLLITATKGIHKRYDDWFYHETQKIVDKCGYINPYLRALGIERADKVYFTPDPSINISLYLMDQLGHTDFGVKRFAYPERMEYLRQRDVKYVLIGDSGLHEKLRQEQPDFINSGLKMGEFRGVHIYKLPEKIATAKTFPIECDVETKTSSGNFLLSKSGQAKFDRAQLQSSDFARSGKFSLRLDSANQFAFNQKIASVKPGDVYTLSVYKYGATDNVFLVASASQNTEKFYVQSQNSTNQPDSWNLTEIRVEIPSNYPKDIPLSLYVWNASGKTVYVDDFKIEKAEKGN